LPGWNDNSPDSVRRTTPTERKGRGKKAWSKGASKARAEEEEETNHARPKPRNARLVRKVELGYDYNTNGTDSTDPRILVA
jgi:hypothetical protein